jgi:hypothetical protein
VNQDCRAQLARVYSAKQKPAVFDGGFVQVAVPIAQEQSWIVDSTPTWHWVLPGM